MSLVYTKSDSVGRKIIPAPIVSITKSYEINDNDVKKGTTYSIVLKGTLLPYNGSPSGSYTNISNSFWNLGGYPPDQQIGMIDGEPFDLLLRKQESLRWLFNEDGGALEWQPAGGQSPVKCYPKVISINFQEGQWVDKCDYEISLTAPLIYINGTIDTEDDFSNDFISSSNETWSFEEVDGRENKQYKVVHEVNAKGKLGYDSVGHLRDDKQAWENAKDYVDTRVNGTVDNDIMFASLGATNKVTGQYSTVIKTDQDGGTYGITEEWLLSNETTYEERQFSVDYDHIKDEYNITYQGTIYGVTTDSLTGEVSNINVAKSNIPDRTTARMTAISYVGSLLGGRTIPSFPSKETFALNQLDGTVSFTYQWNTADNGASYISDDSQLSYSTDDLLHTLTLTQTVNGKGSTPSSRLVNARQSVYNNSAALLQAKSIAATSLVYNLSSTVQLIDPREGIIKTTWVWTDRNSNNLSVTVQTQEQVPIIATIPIPGRASGPIIQNMNTLSSEVVTVTMKSTRNTVGSNPPTPRKPTNLNPSLYLDPGTVILYVLSDVETWNPITGAAERVTRYLIDT